MLGKIFRKRWFYRRIKITTNDGCCGNSEVVNISQTAPQLIRYENTVPVQSQVPVITTCPNCRNPVPPDANFCPMCGLNLSNPYKTLGQ